MILTQDRHSIEGRHNSNWGKGVGHKVGPLPDADEHETRPPGLGVVEGALLLCSCKCHVAVLLQENAKQGIQSNTNTLQETRRKSLKRIVKQFHQRKEMQMGWSATQ